MKRKILSVLTIIFLLGTFMVSTANAATKDELQQQKQDATNKKNQTESELQDIKDEKQSVSDEISSLDSQIDSVEDEIDNLQSQVNELNSSITTKQNEINTKQKEIEEKEALLKKRLVAMYKNGGTSYLDILLGASGPLEMLVTYDAVKEITDADTNLINEVTAQKQTIEDEKKDLENKKAEVDSVKAQQQAKNTELAEKKSQKTAKVAQLSEDEKSKQAELDKFNEEIRQAEQSIKKIEEEAIRKAQQEAQKGTVKKATATGHYNNSSGSLGMPLQSYSYISSFFGPRTRPIAGASTNHGALDFAASSGTPVYAAEAGVVIWKGWVSGYGNYIKIWHKNKGSIYTAYGHLSAYTVDQGDTVSRGQQIGNVGSTGRSTGPHLHFEVYSGGTAHSYRVDPLNYLPI